MDTRVLDGPYPHHGLHGMSMGGFSPYGFAAAVAGLNLPGTPPFNYPAGEYGGGGHSGVGPGSGGGGGGPTPGPPPGHGFSIDGLLTSSHSPTLTSSGAITTSAGHKQNSGR